MSAASVVNLYDDKLTRLEHVAAVTRDYSVKPLIGAPPLMRLSTWARHYVVAKKRGCTPSFYNRVLCVVCDGDDCHSDYRTVSSVKGPLVILDNVKVCFFLP